MGGRETLEQAARRAWLFGRKVELNLSASFPRDSSRIEVPNLSLFLLDQALLGREKSSEAVSVLAEQKESASFCRRPKGRLARKTRRDLSSALSSFSLFRADPSRLEHRRVFLRKTKHVP